MILPTPDPSFRWQQTVAGPALICRSLEPYAAHFFTTRSWMLGSPRAGRAEEGLWQDVAREAGTSSGVARLRQVHGRGVVVARRPQAALAEGDVLITQERGLAIAVQAADCVPLLFVDSKQGVIAAAHAGWRGMVAGVPEATIAALRREFGSRPDDLLVAAGPSIGACCYEVGAEVRSAFAGTTLGDEAVRACFHPAPVCSMVNASMPLGEPRPDHWFFDGWGWIRRQLEACGVPAAQIHVAQLCSASHPDVFPSYRRFGARAGRIAGVIRAI